MFIPRSLCALKRVAAKAEHSRYGATQGIRVMANLGFLSANQPGVYRRVKETNGRAIKL
jgi:hypothetical protein